LGFGFGFGRRDDGDGGDAGGGGGGGGDAGGSPGGGAPGGGTSSGRSTVPEVRVLPAKYSLSTICSAAAIGIAMSAPTTPSTAEPARIATITASGGTLTVRLKMNGCRTLFSTCW
jgi:hypothetical protein